MVHLASYGKLRSEAELPIKKTLPAPQPPSSKMKLEIEDQLEDEHGPLNKRSKVADPHLQQWGTGKDMPLTEGIQYDPLDEPSPLGLRLRKSPSLLDLIQMSLSQANAAVTSRSMENEGLGDEKKKETRSTSALATTEKMKASNFPASILRIGSWEYVSRYEGDLVAKCYFAKRKLVWEILEGGLKSKVEIQWSDITALKANCPEDGPGTLDVVLARQPLFFRETNPQPRKHTLWQATSDFTDGQASIHRKHFLQCPQGLLSKHLEKLIQYDPRLYALSREPDILESPFFEPRCHPFDKLKDSYGSSIQEFQDSALACAGRSTSAKGGTSVDVSIAEIHPPSSVLEPPASKGNGAVGTGETKNQSCWDHLTVPGLKPSMSISDIINQIGYCISDQFALRNPHSSGTVICDKEMLELVESLFTDSQMPASDERSIMSKVNSFCCLLQDAGVVHSQQMNCGGPSTTDNGFRPEEESNKASSRRTAANISRKDSFGELLMHLPRIASLPQFLFDIAEDGEDIGSQK
ncbi:hypothetical protein OPV22_018747 [Ensete ventricosum]|uniref:TRF2/HOY1 PH-like domain-containing protein n=1 Tax=Ensete ventricosum TaxID=4639 RepID=A0AAV8R102_ENSVE|nr:hypothetical protein OPV22_018747 [Ensete ventricosum]